MPRILIIIVACTVFCQVLRSQVPVPKKPASNLRQKWISTRQDKIQLDTLSILPHTFRITALSDSAYELDMVNAVLKWRTKPSVDSVFISYRVFPTRLNAVARRFNYDSISNYFFVQPFAFNNSAQAQDEHFFNFGNITYNGSFGRGISFGNTQDAVVTSNLNLQLSGYLADSIEIAAAITDNNIPIQPDGTTQQLNEFDRIFLQFKKNNWQLNLGDIDIRQTQNYFLNFYKRLQGASFDITEKFGSKSYNRTLVSGSVAKGKFTRNVFQGLEGNQGPYRLQGANNEFFFVVLAGTERVYIDGELLQRGEDRDYVINYNTAEITFMPGRMITKDRRIQVEFEYADRNYLNANLYLYNETGINDKVKLKLAAFNNSDAKNSPVNQTLDPQQKNFLSALGDSIQYAFYPVANLDTFSAGKILYKKIDTVYNGGTHDSIYVYSTSPDSAKYNLSFIEVGVGKGNYVPDFNGANGKVYRWVAPVNGVRQGNFEAATFLVTPKKQQVVSAGIDYNVSKNSVLSTEFALSNYNVNTFSEKDKGDDKGIGAKIAFKNNHQLSNKKVLTTDLGYEYVQATFKPVERLRNVEFTRDWGLPLVVQPADEHIYSGSLSMNDTKSNSFTYQLTGYNRSDGFNGIRNVLTQNQKVNTWQFNNQLSLTNSSTATDKGYFFRPTLNLSKNFPKLKNYALTLSYALEHNEMRNKVKDSVNGQSFSFQTVQAALKSNILKENKWGLVYFNRVNEYPFGKNLVKTDRSNNINLFVELVKSPRQQFRLNTTYRKLEILRSDATTQKPDNSLLSRAEYMVNEWKGFLTGNVLYEIGSGQEQKRDYSYIEVPAGQGEYTWIDYNNDGVQQLNEFEIAVFPDQAKYIRIFTPTNEFIKANYNTFNYSVSLNPRSIINLSTHRNWQHLLARINLQSSLQINKKEQSNGLVQFNPFGTPISDTSLITLSQIYVNTFSFNRFSSKWGFDFNNTRNAGKALLTYGYESRKVNEWSLRTRVNFTKSISFDVTGKKGLSSLNTENPKFDNRNYKIFQYSVEPRVTFTKGANFRLIVGYKYLDKENEEGFNEQYNSNSLNTEIKYNILQSTSIQGKFTYGNISYQSHDPINGLNSTVSYIMLDGLMPGQNFLWNLDFTRRISNFLEFNLQYEGRKPGTGPTVHIGRAAIRALL